MEIEFLQLPQSAEYGTIDATLKIKVVRRRYWHMGTSLLVCHGAHVRQAGGLHSWNKIFRFGANEIFQMLSNC
jgi:hypothetical protein